jgi:zinc/manganese transport system permease protein
MASDPHLTWNIVRDVTQLFEYPFMVNAFRAGTIVAVMAALVGWFMVLRRQTFAGHTLAVVAFPGASGAALIGVSATYGFFAFAIGAALVIAAFSQPGKRGYSEEAAVIGTVQALALASGFLFVSLSARNVTGVQSLLFGSFIGITADQVRVLFVGAVVVLGILGFIARPLLFASIDPDVAAARGVPVRLLSALFLLLLAVAAAEASQITGSLLVFALLVLPPATAELLISRPSLGLAVAVVVAVLVTWLALAMSYYNDYPIGFHVTTLAFAAYLLAQGWRRRPRAIHLLRAGV